MDRLNRSLLAGGMALAAASRLLLLSGMPKHPQRSSSGKPYQTTGEPPPSVGFSNEPHPNLATGMASLYGNKAPGSQSQGRAGRFVQSGRPHAGNADPGPCRPSVHQPKPVRRTRHREHRRLSLQPVRPRLETRC